MDVGVVLVSVALNVQAVAIEQLNVQKLRHILLFLVYFNFEKSFNFLHHFLKL